MSRGDSHEDVFLPRKKKKKGDRNMFSAPQKNGSEGKEESQREHYSSESYIKRKTKHTLNLEKRVPLN